MTRRSARRRICFMHRFLGAEHGGDNVRLRADELSILAKVLVVASQLVRIEREVITPKIDDLVGLSLIMIFEQFMKKVRIASGSGL